MRGLFCKQNMILALLYMARTIPAVFFIMAMPVILRVEGFSLEVIALLPVVSAPYLVKFLWAPLLDRNGGNKNHYKWWVMWTGLSYGVLLMILGSLDLVTQFKWVTALVLIISAIASTQDLAINALYIKLMSFEERGPCSSSKVLALNLGSILGSGCFLLVYNHFGWHAAASGIGILVLVSLLPLPLLREEQRPHEGEGAFRWSALLSFFKTPGMTFWFILLVLNSVASSAVFFMLKPFLVDKGVPTDTIAFLVGFYGMIVAALAAAATGSKRFQRYLLQRRRAYTDSVILRAVAVAIFIPVSLSLGNHILLYLTVALINIAITEASVVSATLFMDYTRKGQESVDYSLQITGTHLGGMIMATASGSIITAIGYTAFFTWQAVFAAVMVLITACVFRGSRIPECSH